jgi:hypothetical protein
MRRLLVCLLLLTLAGCIEGQKPSPLQRTSPAQATQRQVRNGPVEAGKDWSLSAVRLTREGQP